jgi:hypothetical protein
MVCCLLFLNEIPLGLIKPHCIDGQDAPLSIMNKYDR